MKMHVYDVLCTFSSCSLILNFQYLSMASMSGLLPWSDSVLPYSQAESASLSVHLCICV
jgi:hypothetical protein